MRWMGLMFANKYFSVQPLKTNDSICSVRRAEGIVDGRSNTLGIFYSQSRPHSTYSNFTCENLRPILLRMHFTEVQSISKISLASGAYETDCQINDDVLGNLKSLLDVYFILGSTYRKLLLRASFFLASISGRSVYRTLSPLMRLALQITNRFQISALEKKGSPAWSRLR